jgi:hypothetical protein
MAPTIELALGAYQLGLVLLLCVPPSLEFGFALNSR